MEYKKAHEIALRVYKTLEPYCEVDRIDIVGSVRRKAEECNDMEICCIPRTIDITDLFGKVMGNHRTSSFLNAARSLGTIKKGELYDGRFVQILLPENFMLDLFMPTPETYFAKMVIRTGSAQYSHKVIASAWYKKGWCGTEDGLRLQSECYRAKGSFNKWICNTQNPTLPPVWQTEWNFFSWLGLEWVEPSKRYV